MKQLFIDGIASTLFFKSEDDIYNIYSWVCFNTLDRYNESKANIFNLLDQKTCYVRVVNDYEIRILSEKDCLTLGLEEITPINII